MPPNIGRRVSPRQSREVSRKNGMFYVFVFILFYFIKCILFLFYFYSFLIPFYQNKWEVSSAHITSILRICESPGTGHWARRIDLFVRIGCTDGLSFSRTTAMWLGNPPDLAVFWERNVGKTTRNHPFGNGLEWFLHLYTTYKNGDDWGMVDYCFTHITWYTWEMFYCHV